MPTSLYGRGLAKLKTGEKAAASQDMAAAEKLDPHITEIFARLGVAVHPVDGHKQ
jgi:hypothetical protein